jgi:hypothetical protein
MDKGRDNLTFNWSGPKRTWTQQEWDNYRSMPWWLQRPVDVFSTIASVVLWFKRGEKKPN